MTRNEQLRLKILDIADSDYEAVWEILSVVQNTMHLSGEELYSQVSRELDLLIQLGLMEVYQGIEFKGEEQKVTGLAITPQFIESHAKDWQNPSTPNTEYRFLTTDKGIAHLEASVGELGL